MSNKKKSKILIVEDEPVFRLIYRGVLEKEGYEVLEAEDGVQGLKLIKQEMPDLVLLDLILPRMTGYEVLDKIRADNSVRKIPVIVLSVLGGEENVEKALGLGVCQYRVKGDSSPTNILSVIKDMLDDGK